MIMKKVFNFLLTIFLVSLVGYGFTSCGGDDDGDGSKVVDGVNVNNGKKLSKLSIQVPSDYGNDSYTYNLRINYDSKGRLSKVIWTNGSKYENGKYIEGEVEMLKIDYDFKVINFMPSETYYNKDYMFTLNEKGYISQLGDCSITYDSYGYLSKAENMKFIYSLAYEEGELIKSLANNLKKDNIEIYYMFYGEDKDKGDLLFYMNTTSSNRLGDRTDIQGVMLFIAYQAGLLGKMTNHCTYLQRANETTAILQKKSENSNKNYNIRCSFVFE